MVETVTVLIPILVGGVLVVLRRVLKKWTFEFSWSEMQPTHSHRQEVLE